jgi:hypothetical protein
VLINQSIIGDDRLNRLRSNQLLQLDFKNLDPDSYLAGAVYHIHLGKE